MVISDCLKHAPSSIHMFAAGLTEIATWFLVFKLAVLAPVRNISMYRALGATQPHLVVVPLGTLENWEREYAMWAPQLNVVVFHGNQPSRDIIKEYELFTGEAQVCTLGRCPEWQKRLCISS